MNMKKNHILILIIVAVLGIVGACKEDFLNITPNGSLDGSVLGNKDGVDALLIGAYSMLDGIGAGWSWNSASSNWVYGDIRGLIANKGTDSGDQPDINPLQSYSETSTNPYLQGKWREVYEAVSRCNSVILVAATALENGKITQAEHDSFVLQARVLRGWYHFEAWRMWGMIPYIDEETDYKITGNTEDIRSKIIADLTEGTKLPLNMTQIGRFNKSVSQVLLAKAQMQMYHDYAAALPLLNEVIATGTNPAGEDLALYPDYDDIFVIENRNCSEAVYTVQYSVNDGSGGWNAGYGEILNWPYGGPGGCCGFYQPTQEFVNSYRTVGGLPLLDFSYNNDPVISDQGLTSSDPFTPDAGELDPRIDVSVARRGIPYWDWGEHPGASWVRDQSYAGPWQGKKQSYKQSQEGTLTDVTNWTPGLSANGYRMIRFADVILLAAECEIEAGSLDNARNLVNQVRARAANTSGWVMNLAGTDYAANYVINQYPATGYPFDTQANARTALYMERKLELGMEGHRFFDLQRWGIVVTELNRVLAYETTTPWGSQAMYLQGAAVVGSEDIYFPIPQRQLDLQPGILVQNEGH